MYGCVATGFSDTALAELCTQHLRVLGLSSQLGSQRLCFLLHGARKVDPGVVAQVATLKAWAMLVWNRGRPVEDLEAAVDWAERRRKEACSPWQRVLVSTGAMVTTLARIGWHLVNFCTWHTDQVIVLDLKSLAPDTIEKLATAGVVSWQWII